MLYAGPASETLPESGRCAAEYCVFDVVEYLHPGFESRDCG
jgi:hypothetical protein